MRLLRLSQNLMACLFQCANITVESAMKFFLAKIKIPIDKQREVWYNKEKG